MGSSSGHNQFTDKPFANSADEAETPVKKYSRPLPPPPRAGGWGMRSTQILKGETPQKPGNHTKKEEIPID